MGRTLLLALWVCSSSACHTLQFGVSAGPHGEVVKQNNSFFFWGLAPVVVNDVREHCPNGAVAIREQTTVANGIVDLLTLGIWSMRTTWYTCAPGGGES